MKKELILDGLNCASCTDKIETKIGKLDGVEKAGLNFVTKTLTLDIRDDIDYNLLSTSIEQTINSIEKDVKILDKTDENVVKLTTNQHELFDKRELMILIIGSALFFSALIFRFSFWTEFILYLISYILIGGEIVWQAIKNIFKGKVFDENFLMTIATIGAFAIEEFPEGVAVMLFYRVGEFIQGLAVNRSRNSIAGLMDIRPDYANIKIGDDIKVVSPEKVKVGDMIIIKPGEKVPLDGDVVAGQSMVDTSALTGESVPRDVREGSQVLSGFINKNGVLTVKVEKPFGESTVTKILDLVQNANSKKSPTENFITKFARYYTPVVVIISVLLAIGPPLLMEAQTFSKWIYRALVFLVISCPCALVVSIPLGFFGGIGAASKNGVLIKGGNYLEALNNAEILVMDKTGTVTRGVFKVTKINNVSELSDEELLEYAAHAESFSNHPIAISIMDEYGRAIDKGIITDYEEISGHGIKVKVRDKQISIGNAKLMIKDNIDYDKANLVGTIVHITIDNKYAGYILIADEIKEDSKAAIEGLRRIGIKEMVMLTGDNESVANDVATKLGLDRVYAELLPDNKVEKVEEIEKGKSSKGKLLFVGDGINDAPVLARADVGIAMGGLGSDAAIEAADVVLMTDELTKLIGAIRISKKTRKIVWQNIIFSLVIKAIILLLGALGYATMWGAVFADVGVSLIAVLNVMRIIRYKE